ncbi:hypothetical protein [Pseudomonas sp. Leaf129]|uniref:hypothetical protein n=1 Tax=Pseudomonas sp. Leaf129 TaxID=1736268 RepID=UPI0012E6F907|nr:hypothetical protein [Pseudomonas sp. Leaf129]
MSLTSSLRPLLRRYTSLLRVQRPHQASCLLRLFAFSVVGEVDDVFGRWHDGSLLAGGS